MKKNLLVAAAMTAVCSAAQAKLIIGSEEGAGMRIYGFARLDLIYQDSHLSHPQFPEFAPHVGDGEHKDDDLSIHPRLTRLGFSSWSGEVLPGLSLDGQIEIDFQNGGSESRELIRMRHGFGRLVYGGFSVLAGQTWQLVSALYPGANADSMMWNAGNTGDRSPQLRFAYDVPPGDGSNFQAALALMMPNAVDRADRDSNGFTDGADAAIPTIQGRLSYRRALWTKRPFHLGLGGHLGTEEFDHDRDTTTDPKSLTSWGVFAELDLPLHDTVGLRGEFFAGQALSDVRGGIQHLLNQDGDEVETLGFWGELWVEPLLRLSIHAGIGTDMPENVPDPGRSKNQVLWGAVGWRVVPAFLIQAEYHRWTTTHVVRAEALADSVNRVNIHFTYEF